MRWGTRVSSPTLVGRDEELSALITAVTTPPAIVLVQGEAGVGKSRLVTEVLSTTELANRRSLVGRCHPFNEPLPLAPIVNALRGAGDLPDVNDLSPLTGMLALIIPELAEKLPPAPATFNDRGLERHLLFRAMTNVLERLDEVIFVVEDVQWADDATVDFLRFLQVQLPPRMALVMTSRPEGPLSRLSLPPLHGEDARGVVTAAISLAPLDVREVRELVRAITGADELSDEFAGYLHERTGGVPFAVEEVLRLAQDRGVLGQRDGVWRRRGLDELGIPPAIRDSVLERVSRLTPAAQRLLQVLAVTSFPADPSLLGAAARMTDADTVAALTECFESALVSEVEPGEYDFRHMLAARAVYEDTPPPHHRRLHLRIARALERLRPQSVARLARHFREAGEGASWVKYGKLAADVAMARGDDATAVRYLYEILIEASFPVEERGRLAVQLGWALFRSLSRHDDARNLLASMVEDDSLPTMLRGEIRFLLAGCIMGTGDMAEARRQWGRSVDELRDNRSLCVKVMMHLAHPWSVDGTEDEHRGWLALATERGADLETEEERRLLVMARARTLTELADPDGWQALSENLDQALSLESHHELVWSLASTLSGCLTHGYLDRARWLLQEAGRRAADMGYVSFQTVVLESGRILLDWLAGSWEGLEGRACRYAEMTAELPSWAVAGWVVAGNIALARGDRAVAEHHLGACAGPALSAGVMPGLAIASAGLARLRLENDDPEAAVAEARRTVSLIEGKGVWVWAAPVIVVLVEALVALSRAEEAEDLVAALENDLERRDSPLGLACLLLCKGLLLAATRGWRGAASRFAEAQEAFAAMPRPYDAALSAVRRGEALLDGGDASGGEHLATALASLEELGATGDAGRVSRIMRSRGLSLARPWRGGRRGYGSRLSPREREVAQLVAEGKSNAEIASALYLSTKTVKHHVSTAMEKLAVTSRWALAKRWSDRQGE